MNMLTLDELKLVGGALCLDFANTADRADDGTILAEALLDANAWTAWLQRVGISAPPPPLERALVLRTAIYRLFAAVARGEVPTDADIDTLNVLAARARTHQRWTRQRDGSYVRTLMYDGDEHALLALAISVDEILCSPAFELIRQCDGDNCGWLFLDTSKNHTRRWCDMTDCGNRAKARRFLDRKRTR
ncbi:MAG: CGNR zinc finger domain-containing protein [Chloroflexota bacterium]|nr:CGNR zinc finger domain-containing protein [Chloroflexota bacterium]